MMSPKTPIADRRVASRCLAAIREAAPRIAPEDPGERMLAAYALSVEARELFIAGMKASGFSEAEIREALRRRRR
jgi:hypothetical protein